eukprot:Opistho-2@2548
MKIQCLGRQPEVCCYLVHHNDVSILIDCGVGMTSVLSFLPQTPTYKTNPRRPLNRRQDGTVEMGGISFLDEPVRVRAPDYGGIDLAVVDAVLVSSYQSLLGLCHLCANEAFRGRIYATDPTIQLGKLLLLEAHELYSSSYQPPSSSVIGGSEPVPQVAGVGSVADMAHWQLPPDKRKIEATISRIKPVYFNQRIELYGRVTIIPVSSGSSLGSCNWVIETKVHKFAYVGRSSLAAARHPEPFDLNALRGCNTLLLGGISSAPFRVSRAASVPVDSALPSPEAMLVELASVVAATTLKGGSVLIPITPIGVVYDLVEYLHAHLHTSSVPFYFVSPVAANSMALAGIFGEWTCKHRMDRMYLPESPFGHDEIRNSGRLFELKCADGSMASVYREPCVVFCSHPSLRMGDAVHFLERWSGDPNSTLLLTDPEYPTDLLLAPFRPLTINVTVCPIEPCISTTDTARLIKELKPSNIVLPSIYMESRAISIAAPNALVMNNGSTVKVPVSRTRETGTMAGEMSASLFPDATATGTRVRVAVDTMNNRTTVVSMPPQLEQAMSGPAILRGRCIPAEMARAIADSIRKAGLNEVVAIVSDDNNSDALAMTIGDTLCTISISPSRTHVTTADDALRNVVHGAIARHFSKNE